MRNLGVFSARRRDYQVQNLSWTGVSSLDSEKISSSTRKPDGDDYGEGRRCDILSESLMGRNPSEGIAVPLCAFAKAMIGLEIVLPHFVRPSQVRQDPRCITFDENL